MDRLFGAESVAIVGASSDTSKWGGRVLAFMSRYGYQGALTLVNPNVHEIHGIPTVASAAELGDDVDFAVIAVPAARVPKVIHDLGSRGVPYAVVLTSGYGIGGAAASLGELAKTAKSAGIRICGPNSLGIASVPHGLYATGASNLEIGPWEQGGLSIVSQSGAVGLGILACRAQDRGIGLNKLISTGNEVDITCAEVLEYLAVDPTTDSVGIYLEGASDGRRLAAAVTAAVSRGKSVSVLKGGTTSTGALASSTHTGLAAGETAVFRSALIRAGATWCTDLEQILDQAAFHQPGMPQDVRRVALVSTSGGLSILAADALVQQDIELPSLDVETQAKLLEEVGPLSVVVNPVDVAGPAVRDLATFAKVLRITSQDPNVDLALCVLSVVPTYTELVEELRGDPTKGPLAFVSPAGSIANEAVRELQGLGYPVFSSISAASFTLGTHRGTLAGSGGDRKLPASANVSKAFEAALRGASPGECLDDAVIYGELEAFGVSVAPWKVAGSPRALKAATQELQGPWVVKALSTDVIHRTDVGAVHLGLRSEEEVGKAFRALQAIVAPKGSDGSVDVLVQSMAKPGVELLVGAVTDEQFGPVVSVGMGGVLADLYEPSLALAPLGRKGAQSLVEGIMGKSFLNGYRGASAADVAALSDLIGRVAGFGAAAASIGVPFTLDLNPVIVHARGAGATVVDAVVQVSSHQESRRPDYEDQ